MAEEEQSLKCVLYVFPFSLYSIMARLTAVLGEATNQRTRSIEIEKRLVNIHRNENIAEWYLKINSKGQLPSMTVDGLPAPLTDSLDISYWFCEVYPRLLPEERKTQIQGYLSRIHAIEGLSLSAAKPDDPEEDIEENPAISEILARTDISDEYRKALEHKRIVDHSHMTKALHHKSITLAEKQAGDLFEDIAAELALHQDQSLWIFGSEVGPTVLDAHLVAFIARVAEGGRAATIPPDLLQWARGIRDSPHWQQVTHGRKTMWEISYGHVHLLQNF
ncbi:hypothetical protein BX600DRAFT_474402 [Xylariales sp. PMI_506]|nr:hypothetical protein BX600DRAFT_474402 [Xylariales sp. PMI_506]